MRDHLRAVLSDRFAVERELGRGGMASVWLAEDLRHHRRVAIKVLHGELAGAIGVDRFIREVRVTARLQHPNIIPVLDSGVIAGPDGRQLPWYAMPYIDGESLRTRLQRDRQLPVEEALRVTEEVADALMVAHRAGIVHRDIKPENLLLAGGHVYVADFGVAKALLDTGSEQLTSTGLALGTPAYMSPEQVSAEVIDARSDQYSLASVLYEMLAGEPPFTGPTMQAVVARRLAEPARAIRPVRSSVPPPVEAAVLRGLERLPTDRFVDVAAFVRALRAPAVPIPPQRSSNSLLRAGGVVAVAVVAFGGWLLADGRGNRAVARDPEVVALHDRARQAFAKRTPAGTDEAIRDFKMAVARDSTYAAAWSGLAKSYDRAYWRHFGFLGVSRDSIVRLAVRAAERAMALDSMSSDVWVTQGIVNKLVDPTDARLPLRAFRRAIALDSTNAEAWHHLAVNLADSGSMDAGYAAWRRSVSANPRYTQGLAFMALAHFWRRQYDSAARWADSAIAIDPSYFFGRSTLGQVALERGDYAVAAAAFSSALRLSTDVEALNSMGGLALVAARRGERAEAKKLMQQAESLAVVYTPAPQHTAVYFAHVYAALGDRDRAISWLKRYPDVANLHFQLHLRCDPPLDALSTDARFRSLLRFVRPQPPRGC